MAIGRRNLLKIGLIVVVCSDKVGLEEESNLSSLNGNKMRDRRTVVVEIIYSGKCSEWTENCITNHPGVYAR